MKQQGLCLPNSKCQHSNTEAIVKLNLEVLSGEAGRTAVAGFCDMLLAPPNDEAWFPQLGILTKASCLDLLFLGAADAYRRLVMPYGCLPWNMLRIVRQSPHAALATLKALQQQYRSCGHCIDPVFSQAASQHLEASYCHIIKHMSANF